jgi:hypothetical protein
MKRSVYRLSFLLVVLAAALFASGGANTATINPTLYFNYTMNCTFSVVDDSGNPVTSVAPGQYQIDVRTPVPFGTIPKNFSDMTACKGMPQFQLTGPGVNISTTLTAGCESDESYPATLQPSATYVAVDLNQPTVARASFTTLASGTPQKITSPYTNTNLGKGTPNQSIVGSALTAATKATLAGTLTPRGAVTLTMKGKPVTKLAPGKYTFAITDKSTRASFDLLGPKSPKKQNLTGSAFVGKKSVTVTLTKGRWTFLSGLGQIHFFTVGS